jgi:uncharacterized protein
VTHPVTWFEILGPEPERTAKFYSELFGWHAETVEGGYVLIDTHSGAGTNGGIGTVPDGGEPGSVFYARAPEISSLLDKANSLGGTTFQPVTELPMVTYATFRDPWGNVVGLMKGEGEDAGVSPGGNPPVDWFELSCAEPLNAFEFYKSLFDWKIEGGGGEGFIHGSVDTGGPGARGGIGSSPDGAPHVHMYAAVDDLTKYLERAEGLGATVSMPVTRVDEHTEIAMFDDPQGTTFGVYAESH